MVTGSSQPTPSGEGERRAMRGYSAQYHMAASLILRALKDGSLQEVWVADPEAGKVDDLQIGTASEIRAYQFKRKSGEATLSYGELRAEIRGIATGWQQIAQRDSGSRRVLAHLVANVEAASSGPISTLDSIPPDPAHFAAFLETVVDVAPVERIRSSEDVAIGFRSTWDELEERSSLGTDGFAGFMQHFAVELDASVPDGEPLDPRVDPDLRSVYDRLVRWLITTVASEPDIVHISREDLLRKLGWELAFRTLVRHELQVDRSRYSANEPARRDLLGALAAYSTGYVAVLGAPGSGKSYLLSEVFETLDDVAARYYVYLPGEREVAGQRVSPDTLLHDLAVQLEQAGAVVTEGPVPRDLAALRTTLMAQLEWLSNQGRSASILIDGLDYADTLGTNGSRALFEEMPTALPEGIRVVLGSQHLDGIPPQIATQLAEQGRTIEMPPIPSNAASQIIDLARLDLTVASRDLLVQRAAGNPMVLAALLGGLAEIEATERDAWLEEQPNFTGAVADFYEHYWRQVGDDVNLRNLLGKIARWRTAIDPLWLTEGDTAAVQRLGPVGHLFRREDSHRWFFFHESFRIFLTDRTVMAPGDPRSVPDASLDNQYHEDLAARCSRAESTDRRRFEELYHRHRAGDVAGVITLATPAWFRGQSLSYRSPRSVHADIAMAVEAATVAQDAVALVRVVIAAAELGTRESHLEWAEAISPLLIDTGMLAEARDALLNDRQLLVRKDVALDCCATLLRHGYVADAQRLFELAEPRELFGDASYRTTRPNLSPRALDAWGRVALVYRTPKEIVDSVERTTAESFDLHGNTDNLPWARARLLARIAGRFIFEDRGQEAQEVIDGLQRQGGSAAQTWKWLLDVEVATQAGDKDALITLATKLGTDQGPSFGANRVATGLLDVNAIDEARQVLEVIDDPSMSEPEHRIDEGLSPFLDLVDIARAKAAAGIDQDPDELIALRDNGYRRWDRGCRTIMSVGRFMGKMDAKSDEASVEALDKHLAAIEHLGASGSYRDYGTAALADARAPLLAEIVDCVMSASSEHRDRVRQFIVARYERWRPVGWATELPSLLPVSVDAGLVSHDWAAEMLTAGYDRAVEGSDATAHINTCVRYARAWIEIGDNTLARTMIDHAVRASLAVGFRKDVQLSHWVELAAPRLAEDASGELAGFVAGGLVGLRESTEGDAGRWAAPDLIESVNAHPAVVASLVEYLDVHDVLSREQCFAAAIGSLSLDGVDDLVLWSSVRALVHFAGSAYPHVLRQVAAHTDEQLAQHLSMCVQWVAVYAPPTTRLAWRSALVDVAAAHELTASAIGLAQVDLEPNAHAPAERGGASDASFRAVPSIAETLALGSNDSAVEASLRRHAPEMSAEQVDASIEQFGGPGRYVAGRLVPLARRLRELGARSDAARVAEMGIDRGDALAWTRWYGPDKVALGGVLQHTSAREHVRQVVFSAIGRDSADSEHLIGSMGGVLPRLLAILGASNQQVRDAALESETYLRLLLARAARDQPSFRLATNVETASDALKFMLVGLLLAPEPVEAEAALWACRDLCQGDPEFVSFLLGRVDEFMEVDDVLRVLSAADHAPTEAQRKLLLRNASDWERDLVTSWCDIAAGHDPDPTCEFVEDAEQLHRSASLRGEAARRTRSVALIAGGDEKSWRSADAFEESVPDPHDVLLDTHPDGMHVIAESTRLVRLEWERPTEVRESWLEAEVNLVERVADWRSNGEPVLAISTDVIDLLQLRPGKNDHDLQFADGDPAAIRVWWRDGSLLRKPPSFDDEVGEGMILLGSTRMLIELAERFPELARRRDVRRVRGGLTCGRRETRDPVRIDE